MQRYLRILVLMGVLLTGGCSGEDGPKYERQDKLTWQRDQWDALGQELLRRLDPEARAENLSAIDAILSAAPWPLQDGQPWTAVQDGKKLQAVYRLQEEGPRWEVSREWHRTGTEEEETVHTVSIPLKGALSIDKEGRRMADIRLDLQGEDLDQNGILDLQDALSLTAEALAADYSVRFAPCRLSGGEASLACFLSAGGEDLIRYALQTRGLRDFGSEKTLNYPDWDESFRYKEVQLNAEVLEIEADYIVGIHLKGQVESRKLQEILDQITPTLSQAEVEDLVAQASACLHVNWYYEDRLDEPRAVLVMLPAHILNRFDDYWTWEPGVRSNDGSVCSLQEFFSGSPFNDSLDGLRAFLQRLRSLMPFLFA